MVTRRNHKYLFYERSGQQNSHLAKAYQLYLKVFWNACKRVQFSKGAAHLQKLSLLKVIFVKTLEKTVKYLVREPLSQAVWRYRVLLYSFHLWVTWNVNHCKIASWNRIWNKAYFSKPGNFFQLFLIEIWWMWLATSFLWLGHLMLFHYKTFSYFIIRHQRVKSHS